MVLAARVATWTAARQNVFSPGGSRRDVDRSGCLGLPAESVCGRVGLVVAPESGAYTVACINLLTFQEELAYYIYLGYLRYANSSWNVFDAATPQAPFGNEKGRS